ncbi:hypothetical protein SGPA1_70116 [Streptomyces misionensis JCM 4497]
MATARFAVSFPHGRRAGLWTENGEISLPNRNGRIRAARVKPGLLVQRGRPDHEPDRTPLSRSATAPTTTAFPLDRDRYRPRSDRGQGGPLHAAPSIAAPAGAARCEGATAMTAHRPAAGPRHAHPDHDRASPGTFLVNPLRMLLGDPLWCPAPAGTENLLATRHIRARSASSQPSSLSLPLRWLSVEEEIIGSGGRVPSTAGRGRRRPAGGPSLRTEGAA